MNVRFVASLCFLAGWPRVCAALQRAATWGRVGRAALWDDAACSPALGGLCFARYLRRESLGLENESVDGGSMPILYHVAGPRRVRCSCGRADGRESGGGVVVGDGEEEVERCPECGCWAVVGLELGVSSAVDGENYVWRLCVEGWRG